MPNKNFWTPDDDAKLRKLLSDGATYEQAAANMPNRTRSAIRARARRLGCDFTVEARWANGMDATLRKLWPTGMSAREIAAKLGVHDDTVIYRAKRLGLRQRDIRIATGMDNVRCSSPGRDAAAQRKVRNDTIRFEEHYCATAERRGWPIWGYAA